MPILGKRSFSLSMLAQDTVKTEAEIAGKQTQRVSNPKSLLPFLLNPNFLERSFKKIQVHRQPGKPYLIFTSAPGGWEAYRPTSPRKEGTVPKRLPESGCCSGSPRSRQERSLECLISPETFDGVSDGRFHSALCQSNALWEICFDGKSPSSSTLKPWDGSSVKL